MFKKISSLFLIVIYQLIFSQIDTALIKKNITENPEKNFYSLLEIFNSNPSTLNQEQLNQLYYGSRFLKVEYSIADYNRESGKFWKAASKKLSKNKAEKMKDEAESKYLKNPLNKNLLDDMINIYSALNDDQKKELCIIQKNLILQTIKNSGDGTSEETAICVITPGEVLSYLQNLIATGPRGEFEQKMKPLPDDSILTMYRMGERKIFIKLIGGYFF